MIELYTWGTPNGQKIPIMLEECGLPYTVHPVDIGKGQQNTPAFRAINPNGKIPAIVDRQPDGDITVFESGAILIHLAEQSGKLLPSVPAQRMACLSWLFWQIGGFGPMVGQWGFFNRQKDAPNRAALQRYFDESVRLLGVLDARLGAVPYLAGEYSIADIACYTWARAGLHGIGEKHPEVRTQFANLNRWIAAIDARPAVQAGMNVLR